MKNIAITGVSTGIGYGATKELLGRGYRVFGSVRKIEDALKLGEAFGDNFVPLIFDLRDHESVYKAADELKKILGDEYLCGLINNAGATEGGPLMHMSMDSFKSQLDLLLTGQLVVTQAFLPLLGAKKGFDKNPGRIVMISSTSGKSGFPFVGAYAASKHALEGLSKSLRAELLLYGIKVIVVGPGNIKTPIWDKNTPETYELYRNTDYYQPLIRMHKYLEKAVPKDSIDLDVFSRKLVWIFEKKNPRVRYTVVNKPLKHWLISQVIPEKIKIRIVARMFGMNQTG